MILFLVLGVAKRKNAAVIGNAEILICFKNEVNHVFEFVLNLLGSDKQMGVVLTEMSASFNAL